jgi:hypothetical protein
MFLVSWERSQWTRFNGIYFVRFGFRMWEILIFKWFLQLKIQINSKNQVLEGKISWECGNTWRLIIRFKHVFLSYLAIQKIDTNVLFTCWVSLFCNRFTLGPMAHATLVIMVHQSFLEVPSTKPSRSFYELNFLKPLSIIHFKAFC